MVAWQLLLFAFFGRDAIQTYLTSEAPEAVYAQTLAIDCDDAVLVKESRATSLVEHVPIRVAVVRDIDTGRLLAVAVLYIRDRNPKFGPTEPVHFVSATIKQSKHNEHQRLLAVTTSDYVVSDGTVQLLAESAAPFVYGTPKEVRAHKGWT